MTGLTHDSNGEVLSASEWAYDRANRITSAITPDGVSEYDYDKTDQLVDAEHDYQSDESYVYDDNGNRVGDGYVTGENNQLESDGTYNYEYDPEGNRVKRTEIATGEVTEYEWDYRNRLVAVETVDSDGDVTSNSEYTYDVFDRRIAKSVDGDGDGAGEAVVERFVYDGDHIALTFDGEGNQTERFLHGLRIDEVLAQENAGREVLWALADHQGSVRMVLDNEGNVVNNITYDAFGNVTIETNPDVNFRFGYTGREHDDETSLIYYRTRLLDPKTGQFISQDTIGFAGGDSNLYRYVLNSPVNYVDPTGEIVITATAVSVVGATLFVVGAVGTAITIYKNANPSSTTIAPPAPTPTPVPDTAPTPIPIPTPVPDTAPTPTPIPDTAPTPLSEPNNPQQDPNNNDDDDRNRPIPLPLPIPDHDNDQDTETGVCEVQIGDYEPPGEEDDDDDNEYVYRGDERSPAEIFREGGFWPRNPNGNLSLNEHVTGRDDVTGEDINISVESQWVSTSTDEELAAYYGLGFDYNTYEDTYGHVYKINRPPNGRDVVQELGVVPGHENEIAFEGGFSSKYIESSRKIIGETDDGSLILAPPVPFPRGL